MTGLKNRYYLAIFFVIGIAFLIGFLTSFQLPKVRAWVLINLEKASRNYLPVRALPARVELNAFPLGVTFHDLAIFPNEDLAAVLSPLHFKSVEVAVSPWQLIQGQLKITRIALDGAAISIRTPASHDDDESPLKGFFTNLEKIPVDRVTLS